VPTRRQISLPMVAPIVPVLRNQPFDDTAYLFEPKYGGFRGLLYLTGGGCHFRSKRGNVLKQFDELCYWVQQELRVRQAILDGEVVALDPEGRQDFRGLLRAAGTCITPRSMSSGSTGRTCAVCRSHAGSAPSSGSSRLRVRCSHECSRSRAVAVTYSPRRSVWTSRGLWPN
jgi:ATP dependent DNA ligase-like protein